MSSSKPTLQALAKMEELPVLPLSYSPANSDDSAKQLVYTLLPQWDPANGGRGITLVRFTDGITNTLLKCVHNPPEGVSPAEAKELADEESVLLRAYGRDTSILIDRERECASHLLLSRHNLAPALLARFENGLLYKFVAGRVCTVPEMSQPSIWKAVAARLGEWHGTLPTSTTPPSSPASSSSASSSEPDVTLWNVLQKWISALPEASKSQKERKELLQNELDLLQLGEDEGGFNIKGQDGGMGAVVGHCDLLNGNVIILPEDDGVTSASGNTKVHFIDYEYSTPCERAFDIANHFAEWGGFDCDYNLIPTRSTRREFIQHYLQSFHQHRNCFHSATLEAEIESLMAEVDLFRGVPGFYWGIWALIQAEISQIHFDYKGYAEIRLGEYWDWKAEKEGTRVGEIGIREKRWAME
ncbi:uncharacterized protein LAJ45_05812 [Morchella importuna]|uniref:uncharacterized protein n=1 Tax=Morchella importuna TaxID=1174673 RepID=UPI001E8E720F|nr:uncharacterized protein LAJ45_05812 [Morchella importuna]KAH8150126.1 hypothetical protein LAJ45_05812 [Morchella importuna]